MKSNPYSVERRLNRAVGVFSSASPKVKVDVTSAISSIEVLHVRTSL